MFNKARDGKLVSNLLENSGKYLNELGNY